MSLADDWTSGITYPYSIEYENNDIAIAMPSSRADPMLGLNILQG